MFKAYAKYLLGWRWVKMWISLSNSFTVCIVWVCCVLWFICTYTCTHTCIYESIRLQHKYILFLDCIKIFWNLLGLGTQKKSDLQNCIPLICDMEQEVVSNNVRALTNPNTKGKCPGSLRQEWELCGIRCVCKRKAFRATDGFPGALKAPFLYLLSIHSPDFALRMCGKHSTHPSKWYSSQWKIMVVAIPLAKHAHSEEHKRWMNGS